MKILRTTLLLIMGAFLFIQPVGAIVSSTHANATTVEQQSSALKKEFKAEKKTAKLQKMFKKAFDFSDPVNKWLWLAIVCWGVTVIFSILPFTWSLWYLWSLIGTAGAVFFVIWLVKKFAS